MKKIIIILIVIALIGVGYAFKDEIISSIEKQGSGVSINDIEQIGSYTYTESYQHPSLGFSFKHPSNFVVSTIPDTSGAEAVVVVNPETGIGVQILISSFDAGEINITPKMIQENIPDLKISEPQQVVIGDGTRSGVAFKSDSSNFGGASREVWFVYNGRLYQISTYAELDGFLQGLFATWEFK
jgi:hypothetical protein